MEQEVSVLKGGGSQETVSVAPVVVESGYPFEAMLGWGQAARKEVLVDEGPVQGPVLGPH